MHGRDVIVLLVAAYLLGAAPGCSDDCERGEYPAAPAGATALVHVACGCPGEAPDGSAQSPYGTMGEGIAAAAEGSAVLLAAGDCSENVRHDRSISRVGSSDPTSPESARVTLPAPVPYAVLASGAAEVTLRGLQVVNARGVGIWLKEVGTVTVEGCRVEATTAPASAPYGFGSLAVSSDATVLHSLISGSTGIRLLWSDTTGTISDNLLGGSLGGGTRVESSPSEVRIERNIVAGSRDVSIGAISAVMGILIEDRVERTGMGETSGDGILIANLAGDDAAYGCEVRDNQLMDSARQGVWIGSRASGSIQGNELANSGCEEAGLGGGLWLQQGAGSASGVQLDDNDVSGNRCVGIGLTEAAIASMAGNRVRGTLRGLVSSGMDILRHRPLRRRSCRHHGGQRHRILLASRHQPRRGRWGGNHHLGQLDSSRRPCGHPPVPGRHSGDRAGKHHREQRLEQHGRGGGGRNLRPQ